jgi:uncharacterized protein YpmS
MRQTYRRPTFIGRLFLILVALAVVAIVVVIAVGGLSIQNTPDKTSITIDKKELQEKAHEALVKTKEAGSSLLKQTGQDLQKAGHSLNPAPEQPLPPKSDNLNEAAKPQPVEKETR